MSLKSHCQYFKSMCVFIHTLTALFTVFISTKMYKQISLFLPSQKYLVRAVICVLLFTD